MATPVIGVRVSDELYNALKLQADRAGKALSEHARSVLEGAVGSENTDVLKQVLWLKYLLLRTLEKERGEAFAIAVRDAARADAEQALEMIERKRTAGESTVGNAGGADENATGGQE